MPRAYKKKKTDTDDDDSDVEMSDKQEKEKNQAIPPLDPSSATHAKRLLPLCASTIESLYYCDDCSELRCTRCVIEEPAGYHCPNCLFDVPSASVRGEKNCCARNCFQCPICTHVLSVVEGDRRQLSSSSNSSSHSGAADGAAFVFSCSVCLWNSAEIGWTFEKATGISTQIERMREAKDSTKEFANLLEHWRAVQRASAAASSATAMARTRGSAMVGGSFKHRLGSSAGSNAVSGAHALRMSAASMAAGSAAVPEYSAVCHVEKDHQHLNRLMALNSADFVPYSADSLVNEPMRVRLHMKVARRCRQCHHILIKPESKAQATRFKIQLMAANFLPTITLPASLAPQKTPVAGRKDKRRRSAVELPLGPFEPGQSFPVALRLSNPLYTEMQVAVEAASSSSCASVDVLTSKFTLPPFTELWEYDDDEDDDGDVSDGASDKSSASSSMRGILDRQGNRVTIQLNITPLVQASSLTIPLRVTCSHIDDIDVDVDVDVDADSSKSAGKQRVVKSSFWVYVVLGE
ncbi:hypothetical protein GGI11_005181 [Coemansia sp. RSA 2049]|nr:hypothetical protein GGI11_005181 [Coemansia sp. RSA 2049]